MSRPPPRFDTFEDGTPQEVNARRIDSIEKSLEWLVPKMTGGAFSYAPTTK